MTKDTTNYKQLAYSLQTDLEHQKWEQANRDLLFLKEIKDRLIKGKGDVTEMQFALQMIDDWIDELEKIVNE